MATPTVGAPEWAAAQATPWIPANKARRIFDAFCFRTSVADRDLLAPPGSCADGDRFLINGVGTGEWDDHDGEMAIAAGVNASNGWIFAVVARNGVTLYVEDEDLLIAWDTSAWVPSGDGVGLLADLADVDVTGAADGYVLTYDLSNGIWYPAPASGLAGNPTECLMFACSDETSAITAGAGKLTFRMPYAFTLTAVRASVKDAPTGSTIIIDINEGGASILSTKLSIDVSEKTSTGAATPAVISDPNLADDAEMTFDFDQVGSTIAGAGVKVYLIGYQP